MPLPSALLLDLDDTILDDAGARDECWRVACAEAAEAHLGLDAEALRQKVERVRDDFWSDPDRHREWRAADARGMGRIACDALAALEVHGGGLPRDASTRPDRIIRSIAELLLPA